jgi:N4-(beta-N-acetylglucosaminyl)-L-asparaginase
MPDSTFTRRAALLGAAAFPVVRAAVAQGRPRQIVISSANGVAACAKALEVIRAGGDTLDAVIAGVNIVELDPKDNSVGYGGLPNEDGVVELDASVMHGPTRRGGAVASIRGIKTPSKIAKLVMEDTDHMMLVGEGALRFAKDHGFPEEDLLTDQSRLSWLVWKRSLKDAQGHNNWGPGLDAPPAARKTAQWEKLKQEFPQTRREMLALAWDHATNPPHGTINCLALNEKGEISGVTTTSGLAWKIAGRVGDSPILGAGLYVDQDVGAAGSTGRGEENIRIVGAHTIVENMRKGMSPKDAALDALKRVARNFDNDRKRLEAIDLNFYALRKDGEFTGASLWNRRASGAAQFVVATADGPSHRENSVYLLER